MKQTTLLRGLTSLLMVLTLSSCLPELCRHHRHTALLKMDLDYNIQWRGDYRAPIPQRTTDTLTLLPENPSVVQMLACDTTHDMVVTQFLLSEEGGEVACPSGIYNLFFFNADHGDIEVEEQSQSFHSTTRGKALYEERNVEEAIVFPPEMLFTARHIGVEIVESADTLSQPLHLKAELSPVVFTYLFYVDVDEGLSTCRTVAALLSGMADGVSLITGQRSEIPVSLLTEGRITSRGIELQIQAFGTAFHQDHPHYLSLSIGLDNGQTVTREIEVTHLLAESPLGGIVITPSLSITYPLGETPDAGFGTSLDDWNPSSWIEITI